MKATGRLVGRFVLLFALALVALVAAWTVAAPHYGDLVASAARPAFHWVESDAVTVVVAQGDDVWAYRRVGQDRIAPFMVFDRYAFFAVIPLLALFAATPGLRLRLRLGWALGGLCVLFLIHVSYVVASVELSYAAAGLTAGGSHAVAQWLVRIVWEAAPVVIWLAFTGRAWTRSLEAVRDADRSCRDEAPAGARRIFAWTPREGRTE
jgi:hypothetical protein